jgi:hypothetical protein
MTIQKAQTKPAQNEPRSIALSEDQEVTELYDSSHPESYEVHIIQAKTTVKKEREGDDFNNLDKHPAGSDRIDTTRGFTVW